MTTSSSASYLILLEPSESASTASGSVTALIYGLHAGDGNIAYVGQTSRRLSQRLAEHRYKARDNSALPVYKWMREVGIKNVQAMPLDECEIDFINELEQDWIERTGAPLNVKR